MDITKYATPYIMSYNVSKEDKGRPWGGFFCIDDIDTKRFIETYFSQIQNDIDTSQHISPKILVINPGKRLSWQYHLRRKEIWLVLEGPVGISRSRTDDENPMSIMKNGDIIIIDKEERHRILGLDHPAVVAELWCHIDIDNPSDEFDIIRLQDDYNR